MQPRGSSQGWETGGRVPAASTCTLWPEQQLAGLRSSAVGCGPQLWAAALERHDLLFPKAVASVVWQSPPEGVSTAVGTSTGSLRRGLRHLAKLDQESPGQWHGGHLQWGPRALPRRRVQSGSLQTQPRWPLLLFTVEHTAHTCLGLCTAGVGSPQSPEPSTLDTSQVDGEQEQGGERAQDAPPAIFSSASPGLTLRQAFLLQHDCPLGTALRGCPRGHRVWSSCPGSLRGAGHPRHGHTSSEAQSAREAFSPFLRLPPPSLASVSAGQALEAWQGVCTLPGPQEAAFDPGMTRGGSARAQRQGQRLFLALLLHALDKPVAVLALTQGAAAGGAGGGPPHAACSFQTEEVGGSAETAPGPGDCQTRGFPISEEKQAFTILLKYQCLQMLLQKHAEQAQTLK